MSGCELEDCPTASGRFSAKAITPLSLVPNLVMRTVFPEKSSHSKTLPDSLYGDAFTNAQKRGFATFLYFQNSCALTSLQSPAGKGFPVWELPNFSVFSTQNVVVIEFLV